jgi:hypothetical protein
MELRAIEKTADVLEDIGTFYHFDFNIRLKKLRREEFSS